jgi:hypothetical protein
VHVPSDDVTIVRPLAVLEDMLFAVPVESALLETPPPLLEVIPETFPPPAVTELVMPPLLVLLLVTGGFWPGFK